MSEIRHWLDKVGLAHYADLFEANALDLALLADVTDEALSDIGVVTADLKDAKALLDELAAGAA